jgi:hypothetical protein
MPHPIVLGLLLLAVCITTFAAIPQSLNRISSRPGCSCIESFEKEKLHLHSKWLDRYLQETRIGRSREKSRNTAINGLRKDLQELKSGCGMDFELEVGFLWDILPFLPMEMPFFFVLFSQDALQELAEDMADDDLDVSMCRRAFFSEVGLYG